MQAQDPVIFEQQFGNGHTRRIELIDARSLRVADHGKSRKSSFMIDLLALQDSTRQVDHIAWHWLWLGTLAAIGLTLFTGFLPTLFQQFHLALKSLVLISGISLIGFLFYLYIRQSYREIIFCSRHAAVPVISLRMDHSCRRQLEKFKQLIGEKINNAQKSVQLDLQQQLAGEMRTLRRLSQEGVLGQKTYTQGKAVLLNLSDRGVPS